MRWFPVAFLAKAIFIVTREESNSQPLCYKFAGLTTTPGVGKLRPAECFFVACQELVSSKTTVLPFSFSNRLILYERFINM